MGDGVLELGGDEGFDDDGVVLVSVGEDAEVEEGFEAVPCHEGTDLIACDELHASGAVADGDAHAVAIGVGADDDVGVFLFCEVEGHLEGRGVFRVGGDDGGEAAVGDVLSGDG